jgi:predicted signal transduction protein with EAL and GGDEF domain
MTLKAIKCGQVPCGEIFISSSIGVALYPGDGEDADTLMRSAEAAMYQAKDQGKNTFQFFARKSDPQAESRLAIATRLHKRHSAEGTLPAIPAAGLP